MNSVAQLTFSIAIMLVAAACYFNVRRDLSPGADAAATYYAVTTD